MLPSTNQWIFRKYINFSLLTKCLRGSDLACGPQFGDPWVTQSLVKSSWLLVAAAQMVCFSPNDFCILKMPTEIGSINSIIFL